MPLIPYDPTRTLFIPFPEVIPINQFVVSLVCQDVEVKVLIVVVDANVV